MKLYALVAKSILVLLAPLSVALSTLAHAGLVSGFGVNVEAIEASASVVNDRVLILAGRRTAGADFGPFAEVSLIDVAADGGPGLITRIPELDGSRADEFRFVFGSNGDLWVVKTRLSGNLRLSKISGTRSLSVDISLPADLKEGDVRVQAIYLPGDGTIELALRRSGDGVLLVLAPDASIKSIQPISDSAEFQSLIRIPGSGNSLVASASGTISLIGNVDSKLSVRGPDMKIAGPIYQEKGLFSKPVFNPDGSRVAIAIKTALPGRVVVSLLTPKLEKLSSSTVVEKKSFTGSVSLVFVRDRLISLQADAGRCYIDEFNSFDGKVIRRREVQTGGASRCIGIKGIKSGAGMLLVTSKVNIVGGMLESTIETSFLTSIE